MARKKSATLFEDSLKELEVIVEQLEQGDISLEESLKSFEQGVKLTRTCQKALQDAEQKVQILLEKNGQQTLESFTDE
ncbi:MAG: exodeoxyribonuclease VII small subunit [Methyloprofundus sp.]|nr:MAG: exodeoxyribonuclease VII small subunit [Methyloprofundus sp.]